MGQICNCNRRVFRGVFSLLTEWSLAVTKNDYQNVLT